MPPYKLIIFDLDGTLTSLRLSPVHDAPLVVLPNVHTKLTELSEAGITLALATNQMNGDFRGRIFTDAIIEERLKAVADLFPMIPLRWMQVAKPDNPDWKPSPNMLLALGIIFGGNPECSPLLSISGVLNLAVHVRAINNRI